MSDYLGQFAKGDYTLRCVLCDELATHYGYPTSKYLPGSSPTPYCEEHGTAARKDWVVTHLEEVPAYTKFKMQQRRNHPTMQNSDATGLFDA